MPKSILIIDDDPIFHEDMKLLLGDRAEVSSAFCTKEALELLRKCDYDLILLDLAMPPHIAERGEPEGLAIYYWIKKNKIEGKVIIATGQKDLISQTKQEINAGTDIYLKPLEAGRVRSILNDD